MSKLDRRTGVLAVIALIAVACAPTSIGPDERAGAVPAHQDGSVTTLSASWAWGYANLAELAAHADAVVVGRIAGIAYQGPDPQDPTLPRTRYDIEVERSIAGEAPTELQVVQTGGPLDGRLAIVEGDPLMRPGETYLMYLRAVPSGPDKGRFVVLGGPQGRFSVGADATLGVVGDPHIDLPPGMTVAEVVRQR